MFSTTSMQATSTSDVDRDVRSRAWRVYQEADQFAADIAGARLTITPRERVRGPWTLLPIALEHGSLQFAAEPCASMTHGTITDEVAGFAVSIGATDSYRMDGQTLQGGPAFGIFGSGAPYFASSQSATRWALLSFRRAELAAALASLRGEETASLEALERPMFASASAAAAIADLLAATLQRAESEPGTLSSQTERAALQAALLDAFARALDSAAAPRADRVKLPATRLVRQCEEHLETRMASPVYVAELCQLTGASERTLRNAFQSVYRTGPTRYLMQRRLANARRALREPQPGDTVTTIATRHGLWDLGRFAADYRALYGEPPSATLRAARRGGG